MEGYTITQVAEKIHVKVHTIRYWEKNVPLISVYRDAQGKRIYNRQDVYLLIRLKYYIEQKNFTLKGAANELVKEMSESSQPKGRMQVLDIMKHLEVQKGRLSDAKKIIQGGDQRFVLEETDGGALLALDTKDVDVKEKKHEEQNE